VEVALRPRESGRDMWQRLARGAKVDTDFGSGVDQSTGQASFD